MEKNNLKRNNILKKKLAQARNLAKTAVKNKPKWKPSPGYKYLKDIRIGELVETQSGTRAVLLSVNDVSANVLVTSVDYIICENKSYYLGKHRWSSGTEVKLV